MSHPSRPPQRRLILVLLLFFAVAGCTSSQKAATPTTGEQADSTAAAVNAPPPRLPDRIQRTQPEPIAVAGVGLDTLRAGRFDSGKMWTFENPPTQYFAEAYDFQPDAGWFERARLGALRIPGCTASFVSPNGLIMTNHHCARGHLPKVERAGERLLDEGFYAASVAEERRVDGMYADQLIDLVDVTGEIDAALEGQETTAERASARQEAQAAIEARLRAQYAGEEEEIHIEIVSLYQGGRYSAYVYRRYTDVRFVLIPEVELGAFGGDYDNFTYPRYSLDMSFFRAYGADGEPVQSDNHYGWSREGSEAGEVVFVVGNPGSTSRLLTVAQIEYRRDVQEKAIARMVNTRVAALEGYYAANPDEAEAFDVRNLLAGWRNAQKFYNGSLTALQDPAMLARRRDAEKRFAEALAAEAALQSKYGTLIDRLAGVQAQKRELAAVYGAFLALAPQSSYGSVVLRRALLAARYLEQQAGGADEAALAQLRTQLLGVQDQPVALQERLLSARLHDWVLYFGADDPVIGQVIADRTPEAAAEAIVQGSVLTTAEQTAAALEAGTLSPQDPAVAMGAAILPAYADYQRSFSALQAQEQEVASQVGRAKYDVYGTDLPPDATFTLRLADGVVAGYPYNGTYAPPYTTYYGLYDHFYSYRGDEGAASWALPKRWLTPPEAFALETPLNLVSTNDIIGGNSGSALLNKDLEVVGLVFDGNIESLSGAFIYLTDVPRTISVDARGIVEALDDIYGADRLVLELLENRFVPSETEADAMTMGQE